jgi:hypothetical protein
MSEFSLDTPSRVAPKKSETSAVSGVDLLRSMYEVGAAQLWKEKFGTEPDIGDKEYATYLDTLFKHINFDDRTKWREGVGLLGKFFGGSDLEQGLIEAANRRLNELSNDLIAPNVKQIEA